MPRESHKVLLSAWSSVLRDRIKRETRRQATQRKGGLLLLKISVDISDLIENYEPSMETVISRVFAFLYGRPLTLANLSIKMIFAMLTLSRNLSIKAIEDRCWSFLSSCVNEKTCIPLHALADRFGHDPFKRICWDQITSSFPEYQTPPSAALASGSGSHPIDPPHEVLLTVNPEGSENSYSNGSPTEETDDPVVEALNVVHEWAMHLQREWEKCLVSEESISGGLASEEALDLRLQEHYDVVPAPI